MQIANTKNLSHVYCINHKIYGLEIFARHYPFIKDRSVFTLDRTVIANYISEGSISHINGVRPGFLEIQLIQVAVICSNFNNIDLHRKPLML